MARRASLLVRGFTMLALVTGLFAGFCAARNAAAFAPAVVEVSAPTPLTSGAQYDRNPVFLHTSAGTELLFFARSTDPCARNAACNADAATYTPQALRSTDGGGTWSAPTQIADRTGLNVNFYGRTIAAAQDGAGTIWVFWASGGNNGPLYVFTSTNDGVSFAPQAALSDQPYFNVEVVTNASGQLWLFYEDGGGGANASGSYVRSYTGAA